MRNEGNNNLSIWHGPCIILFVIKFYHKYQAHHHLPMKVSGFWLHTQKQRMATSGLIYY